MKRLLLRTGLLFLTISLQAQAARLDVPSPAFKTISHAMIKARPGDTIVVADGIYRESIFIGPGVTVLGATYLGARIDGRGRGTVVTMSRDSRLEGIEVKNGTTGVFVRYSGCSIARCRIVDHRSTGVLCFGLIPEMADNVIVYNRGSGVQIRDARPLGNGIVHNTIAFNGNHGILVEVSRDLQIRENIIAFNEGLGVRISEDSRNVDLVNNNIYGNFGKQYEVPSGNFAVDPLFKAPKARSMDFSLLPESLCRRRGENNEDIGARLRRE